ncbi:MAG: hypothetical protein AABY22_00820 [Nanoarchaeota archaeon]
MLKPKELLIKIIKYIPEITKEEWDAKECILKMKGEGYRNWRQTEWVGFYLEFLTERTNVPGVAQFKLFVGNTSFNGCAGQNIIDYKTSSDNEDIILNDQEAIQRVVKKYKELGYIIIQGKVEKEKGKELDDWRKEFTGKSKYVLEGEKSGRFHRRLKTKFYPTRIVYVAITKENIGRLKQFNQGKNSDGKPRNPKYILPKKILKEFTKAELDIFQFKKKKITVS